MPRAWAYVVGTVRHILAIPDREGWASPPSRRPSLYVYQYLQACDHRNRPRAVPTQAPAASPRAAGAMTKGLRSREISSTPRTIATVFTHRRWHDPITATASAGQDVVGPCHGDILAEERAEQRQLVATQALTGRGSGADRAMILGFAAAIAGAMIVRSSCPNIPCSPACGFSPSTAMRGLRIAKSMRNVSLRSINFSRIAFAESAFGTLAIAM